MRKTESKAVFTDLDGTLIQSADAICDALHDSFLHVNQTPPSKDAVMNMFGLPVEVMLTRLTEVRPEDKAVIEEFLAEYKRQYPIHMEAAKLIPGAKETMDEIAGMGLPICLITSERRQNAEHILIRLGLAKVIPFLITRDDVEHFKPDPEPLLKAAELLKVDPSDCIYIGESPFDMEAGIRAGVYTVGVPSGHWSRESLEECGPDQMVDQITELLDVINGKVRR